MEHKRGWITTIERIGNRLPDPATLFLLACVAVVAISSVVAGAGLSVADPRTPGAIAHATSLTDPGQLTWIATHLVRNFLDFQPLGVVLVAMLGIGVAERVGLFAAVMRTLVLATPARLLTPAVVFAGVSASIAADAGYVVLPPLVGGMYARAGRSPLVGIAAVTFGIAGGFSANVLITALDPLLAGMTEQAARLTDPAAIVPPTCNWAFMASSALVLTLVGWFITERVVEPQVAVSDAAATAVPEHVPGERRALVAAAIVGALVLAAYAAMVMVPGALLAGTVERTPGHPVPAWSEAIVPLLLAVFLLPALVFGGMTGSIRSDKDVARAMGEAMSGMGSYLVLAFFAGQFIALFQRSDLAVLMAVSGGDAIGHLGLAKPVLLVAIVLATAALNLLIVSASAKWALLAPVMVPLFGQLGLAPDLVQAAYRVGDSVTNPISPLNPYLIVVLVTIRKHQPDAGLGTVLALLLPYSVAALVVWTIWLLVWVGSGLPLGTF